jgi:hypothetical protein
MSAFDHPQYEMVSGGRDGEPTRGWFSRNWMWVIPVGCLLPVIVCGGVITGFVFLALQGVKKIDVYQQSVGLALSNGQVMDALGAPVEPGMPSRFQYRLNGGAGSANFAIPLNGSRASGTLFVEADRVNGSWNYKLLEVELPGRADRIELRPSVVAAPDLGSGDVSSETDASEPVDGTAVPGAVPRP